MTDAGFHPLLHVYCHHQIVHAKFNLKFTTPIPYEREVRHFPKADINLIRKALTKLN